MKQNREEMFKNLGPFDPLPQPRSLLEVAEKLGIPIPKKQKDNPSQPAADSDSKP